MTGQGARMSCSATLALAALFGLAGCAEPAPQAKGPLPLYRSLADPAASIDAATVREMISAYRGNKGLGPLAVDPDLQRLAEAEARAMAAAERPASAEAVKNKLVKAGFAAPQANLSAGYHTWAEAFSGWRESAQHDRVMLDRKAARMGIATAYAPGSKYKVYWAFVVAGPEK
jgi:uncharacterized protein YkwD